MAQVRIRCCLGEEIRTSVYSRIPLCIEVISLPLLVLFTISSAPGRSRGIREQKSLLSWKISSSSQKNWDFFFLNQWSGEKFLWQPFRLFLGYPTFFSILLMKKSSGYPSWITLCCFSSVSQTQLLGFSTWVSVGFPLWKKKGIFQVTVTFYVCFSTVFRFHKLGYGWFMPLLSWQWELIKMPSSTLPSALTKKRKDGGGQIRGNLRKAKTRLVIENWVNE